VTVVNMHPRIQRTAAEAALLQTFEDQVTRLPGDAAVAHRRDAAMELVKQGLPSRRVEAWHYTDLRRLLTSVPPLAEPARAAELAPLLPGSAVFAISNGDVGPRPQMPGLASSRLAEHLASGTLAPVLQALASDDFVGALNAALVADGFVLRVAPGTALERPVELQNLHTGGQAYARFAVDVGAGASGVFVERQTGQGAGFVSSVTDLRLEDDAKATWIVVQEQPEGASHFGQLRASLGKNAHLTLFVMNAGGRLVRQELRVKAAGEGAQFTLRGVNLLSGDAHSDLTMIVDHSVPHTGSTEIVRNVVTDRAHGVFQGRINVHQVAQKTDARMACNTLLLSDDAEFDTKPELEIFADDVACGHGATVTEIDRNHLFYLMARGIDEKTARGLLVKAFVAEVIEELEDEAVVAALEAKLDAWFAAHG
jgi:Fe-S cluster assembly protein SufD